MTSRTALILAGVTGFLAVVAGTFGAHALEGWLDPDALETYEVGVRYHAYHALAILACVGFIDRLRSVGRASPWCFVVGIALFSLSLYGLALTGQRWLGAITPFGGVALLVGWAFLFVDAAKWSHPS